jgi:hypothetical protein
MTSRTIGTYRIAVGKHGREVLVEVRKRREVCTELKRKNSKSVRVARKGRS